MAKSISGPRYWREGVSFIKAELELGLAFSVIALRSRDWTTTARKAANARMTFAVAQRYVKRVLLTSDDSKEIDEGFAQLGTNLAQLSAFLSGSTRSDPTERC